MGKTTAELLVDIIHDMEEIILRRARRAELKAISDKCEGNISVYNEYKVLLDKLDLSEQYDELYS